MNLNEMLDFVNLIIQTHGLSTALWCAIVVAIIYIVCKVIPHIIIRFSDMKMKVEQEHHDRSIMARHENIQKINDILELLRIDMGAQKAMIFEYHNGGANSSGLCFLHMSIQYERQSIGEEPISKDFSNLSLSLFPNLVHDLDKGEIIYIKDIEKESQRYVLLAPSLIKNNYKEAVIMPIYGTNKSQLGFIILCFRSNNIYNQTESLPTIAKGIQPISSLLDYENIKKQSEKKKSWFKLSK